VNESSSRALGAITPAQIRWAAVIGQLLAEKWSASRQSSSSTSLVYPSPQHGDEIHGTSRKRCGTPPTAEPRRAADQDLSMGGDHT
jgi:hypothetical protein